MIADLDGLGRRRRIWGLAVVLVMLAGCTSTAVTSASSSAPTSSATSASPEASTDSSSTAESATTSAPAGTPTTGGEVVLPAGVILPNPARTPGATNPHVTQANIHQTICVSGWTSTVRPPSSYTTGLKEQQLASGYAYHGDTNPSDYEEDHLISLEIGGSPTSTLNLWPEPYQATDGAHTKDAVENKLHALVCAGSLSLAAAQHAIASNWWTAYSTYIGTPASAAPATTRPAPPPTVAVGPPAGATALCNDGTYSYAAHHQGACSHHGGVKVFYK